MEGGRVPAGWLSCSVAEIVRWEASWASVVRRGWQTTVWRGAGGDKHGGQCGGAAQGLSRPRWEGQRPASSLWSRKSTLVRCTCPFRGWVRVGSSAHCVCIQQRSECGLAGPTFRPHVGPQFLCDGVTVPSVGCRPLPAEVELPEHWTKQQGTETLGQAAGTFPGPLSSRGVSLGIPHRPQGSPPG